ncbi:Protein phosphatase 1D [Trichinella spiralis]|uniref:Protein phosphatase 1D n=1 Tax=Trichinella spiralis TaxID=6334 RepID=A0A0V1BYC3_TRISP|nr:Protein phosphatase 1D [Trichinella spiralis]
MYCQQGKMPSKKSSPESSAASNNLSISTCSCRGSRKYMEDRFSIRCCTKVTRNRAGYAYFGIFDGHGGAEASEFARKHLHDNITQQKMFWSKNDNDVLKAITDGFLQTHEQMTKEIKKWPQTSSGLPSTSGTTASVAFVRQNKIYIGHVGDSTVVLGKRNRDGSVGAVKLTVDHKPDAPAEKKRLAEVGGEVADTNSGKRVIWNQPAVPNAGTSTETPAVVKVPFLNLTRSLGDLWSYNPSSKQYVVSPEPDVSVIQLEKEDACLVIASDGLWNILDAQTVIDIINCGEWKEKADQTPKTKNYTLPKNHARWITRQALIRCSRLRSDNISVIVVLFDPTNPSGSSLPESCILSDRPSFDIDKLLAEKPSAVLDIRGQSMLALKAAPVELLVDTAETKQRQTSPEPVDVDNIRVIPPATPRSCPIHRSTVWQKYSDRAFTSPPPSFRLPPYNNRMRFRRAVTNNLTTAQALVWRFVQRRREMESYGRGPAPDKFKG